MKRIIFSILILTVVFTMQGLICSSSFAADSNGPVLGKWAFDGKDDKGVAWKGTLTIAVLDTNRFNTEKYHSMCTLEAESKNAGKGVDTPCTWDPAKRVISFGAMRSSYSAILSSEGKSMTQGKWTETDKDFKTSKVTVKSTGVWSAKYTGQ